MSDSWDDYADGWDANPDVIAYSQLAFNSLQKHMTLSGLSILDFGCGTGLLTERLLNAGAHVVAIDSSEKMIDALESKSLNQIECHKALLTDAFLIEHPDWLNRFDLVVASSVLAFVPDYEVCLSLLAQCLKTKGKLIHWDWLKHDDFGFNETDIDHGFKAAHLKVIDINPNEFIMESEKGSMAVIKGFGEKI